MGKNYLLYDPMVTINKTAWTWDFYSTNIRYYGVLA